MTDYEKKQQEKIKKLAYEDMQETLKDEKLFKDCKKIYELLKNVSAEDIVLMPTIKTTRASLNYMACIYTQRKYSDGSLGSEYLEGRFKEESTRSYHSLENLDALDSKILSRSDLLTIEKFSLEIGTDYRANYLLFDALNEEMENKYLIANHLELMRYPSNIRAVVYAIEPSSTSFSCEYYPVAVKINIRENQVLYYVINLYGYDETVSKNKSEYFRFDCLKKPIIFDENRNMLQWKKGLFGFKLV